STVYPACGRHGVIRLKPVLPIICGVSPQHHNGLRLWQLTGRHMGMLKFQATAQPQRCGWYRPQQQPPQSGGNKGPACLAPSDKQENDAYSDQYQSQVAWYHQSGQLSAQCHGMLRVMALVKMGCSVSSTSDNDGQ